MKYSHYGCNVVHEDIAFKMIKETSTTNNSNHHLNEKKLKEHIKKIIESKGGILPAEHGHGTEYIAPIETQERWMKMDPCNIMNPGVGGLSYNKYYKK